MQSSLQASTLHVTVSHWSIWMQVLVLCNDEKNNWESDRCVYYSVFPTLFQANHLVYCTLLFSYIQYVWEPQKSSQQDSNPRCHSFSAGLSLGFKGQRLTDCAMGATHMCYMGYMSSVSFRFLALGPKELLKQSNNIYIWYISTRNSRDFWALKSGFIEVVESNHCSL